MKKLISFIIVITILITIFCNSFAFSDTGSHWAKSYIEQLTGMGAIKGYTDGTFRPDKTITRAEFTAILLRALGSDAGQPETGKWYEYYIAEAQEKRYILEGEFDSVEENITRGEMARMIIRALDESFPEDMDKFTSLIADYKDIPAGFKDYVLKAYVKGIITGRPGGVFAYNDTATRAEATTMIVRLIDESKRIVPELPQPLIIDGKEVVTSHPEMIPHIKKGMEIMSKDGYYVVDYSSEYNQVDLTLYKSKEDSEVPAWERHSILRYHIYTERNPKYEPERIFYAYRVALEEPESEMARNMFVQIVKDLCPEMKVKAEAIVTKKIQDSNYQEQIYTEVNGKNIDLGVQAQYNQIGFGMSY